jgi:dihydrodiol dehydrogenase / D-xylose 1-dehydrogenase (NADP)
MTIPRFAIVGTGTMAATMATLFRKTGVPLNAVVSRSPERAGAFARQFGIAAGESDLGSVLARSDIDAVYVANVASEHAATVVTALRANKAVLCEKPMATSEAELISILQIAEQSNVLCMEALWTLCLPSHRRFFDYANSGKWGAPRSLTASFAYPSSEVAKQRADSANRAGVLLDRSIYLIALAISTLGPVIDLDAQIHFDSSGTDTDAFLQLKHASGAHSQLASSFTCLMTNAAALHCSLGLIEIASPLIGSEVLSTRHAAEMHNSDDTERPPNLAGKLRNRLRKSPRIRQIKRIGDRPTIHHFDFGSDKYQPQLTHFLRLLDTEKKVSDIVPLKLSMEIIQVIEKAKKRV